MRGEFPWLVAHFHQKRRYICSGSLVSQKIVVTAAHCIWNKGDPEPISEYDSNYYLGKYKLNEIEDDLITSDVQKFITHPKWDPESTLR